MHRPALGDQIPCHCTHNRIIRFPRKPNALPMPPSPKVRSASASPTNCMRVANPILHALVRSP